MIEQYLLNTNKNTTYFAKKLELNNTTPSQIVSHSKNLGESKHFSRLTKIIERNTKICNVE